MSAIFRICRAVNHLVPAPIRSANWLQQVSQTFGRQFGGHDAVYTDYYYRHIVDPGAKQIAAPLADLVAEIPLPEESAFKGVSPDGILADCVFVYDLSSHINAGLAINQTRLTP